MSVVLRDVREQVQPDGEFQIAGVEVAEVVGTERRDVVQEFLRQVPVRVNEAHPIASGDVLDDEVLEQGRLADAGLSDHIHMLAGILPAKAKRLGAFPAVPFANDDGGVVLHGSKANRHSWSRPQVPACSRTWGGIRAGPRVPTLAPANAVWDELVR